MKFLTSGYAVDIDQLVNNALFTVDYSEMVIVKDIDFYSLCEHHLLPFFGKCHVAYLPRTKVIGLSKIPRIVDAFSRRLQVQERLTNEVAQTIQAAIDPLGVGVVMEGTHLCMAMRGVEKQNSFAVTSAMLGTFRTDARTRTEFLNLIRQRPAELSLTSGGRVPRAAVGLAPAAVHVVDGDADDRTWRRTVSPVTGARDEHVERERLLQERVAEAARPVRDRRCDRRSRT